MPEANCETHALSLEHDMQQAAAPGMWLCTEHWLTNPVPANSHHCKQNRVHIKEKPISYKTRVKGAGIRQCNIILPFSSQ